GVEERLSAHVPARVGDLGHVEREPGVPVDGAGKRGEVVRDKPGEILGGALELSGYRLLRVAAGQLLDQRHLGVAAQVRAVECFPQRWFGGVPEPGYDLYRRRPDRRA